MYIKYSFKSVGIFKYKKIIKQKYLDPVTSLMPSPFLLGRFWLSGGIVPSNSAPKPQIGGNPLGRTEKQGRELTQERGRLE